MTILHRLPLTKQHVLSEMYWALPIYECPQCGTFEVIGSRQELKERAVEGWEEFEGHTPHRPWVDAVKIKCRQCGTEVARIKDVGNPWLDAGIVPLNHERPLRERSPLCRHLG
jgi:isoleucyl-tRNA synthetase